MTKPDITLERSKGVVSQMAAQIYAAYIARGALKDGEEANWMQRSIREAVRIAKTVAASVESDDEPDSGRDSIAGQNQAAAETSDSPPPSPPDPPRSSASESAGRALQDPEFDDMLGETLGENSS